MLMTILAQYDSGAEAAGAGFGLMTCCCFCLFPLAIFLAVAIGLFKIFAKANKPGWAAFVPFYNYMVVAEIVGRPSWHGLLLLVPILNIIMAILLSIELAKSFGKETVYGILLFLLPIIFIPLLGFGSDTYRGPVRDPANTSLF